MTQTDECEDCKIRFKKLTEEGLCFSCHYSKYHQHPKEWQPIGKYKQ